MEQERQSHYSRLLLVEAASLSEKGLALRSLSTNRAESLDAEGLTRLHGRSGPVHDGLVSLGSLSTKGSLLGDDLSVFVLHQVALGQSTGGLLLGSTEDEVLPLGDLGDLHGHLAHHHGLHAHLRL